MIEKLYIINLLIFLSGVAIFATLESFFAFRKNKDSKRFLRWGENLSLTFLNTLIIRVFLIITPLSAALYTTQNGIGIFHWLWVPEIIAGIVIFLLLDLIVYGEHVLFHKVSFFWKFHKVHHSDLDLDFSTALRFHFLESIISVITKVGVVFIFWPPVIAVIVFEVVLNLSAMFNHSNFTLPKKLDILISKIIVTPKFHEIHHSQKLSDSLSNYGFFLSIWDYVFHTYETHSKKISRIGLTGQEKRYGIKKLLSLSIED